MKIRTLSIFAAAAIVSLAACGGGDEAGDTGDTDTTTVAPAPLPAPLPPATGDTMGTDTGMAGMDTMTHDTMTKDSM